PLDGSSGADETRTRDLRRDRTAERLSSCRFRASIGLLPHFPAPYAASRVQQRIQKKGSTASHRTTPAKSSIFILSYSTSRAYVKRDGGCAMPSTNGMLPDDPTARAAAMAARCEKA